MLTSTTELLCPLKHPSELATHPSLSLPFLDPALPNMIEETEVKLRQERVNLWRAKHLHRELIGDESWMPLERVETQDDWDLFVHAQIRAQRLQPRYRCRLLQLAL